MDKDEARARLIALAENTPKGEQRDALVMGANALINDIANQWLEEYDKQTRADAIDEFVKGCKATHDGLICNWDKPYGITFERMEEKAKQLKEQK